MPQDLTSLDRLHDIVLPPEVSWWPLAPGWCVLVGLFVLAAGFLAVTRFQKWRANAYRRIAIRELQGLNDAASVAELLRRTALVGYSRQEIAATIGEHWVDWLAARCSEEMRPEVRQQLSQGIYRRPEEDSDIGFLKEYAGIWVRNHTRSESSLQRSNAETVKVSEA